MSAAYWPSDGHLPTDIKDQGSGILDLVDFLSCLETSATTSNIPIIRQHFH